MKEIIWGPTICVNPGIIYRVSLYKSLNYGLKHLRGPVIANHSRANFASGSVKYSQNPYLSLMNRKILRSNVCY